jgi:signal transduction histidine kinase
VNTIPLSHIFGPELYGRVVWFGRLRWLAVSGLALASLAGPRLGFPSVWPSLFVVASVVAAYNLVFQRLLLLHRRRQYDRAHGTLRIIAVYLMVLDLGALMVTIHFTGGLQSPLLPFFTFHMALGTILIARRWTYLLAGVVSLGALALLAMEARGILRFHPLIAGGDLEPMTAGFNLLTLAATLFGVVYLTDSVASRLTQRSIDLFETTEALSERTEELHRLLGAMEELERRKSHYMRISAHKLRSPLGTIRTTLRVLIDRFVDPASERGDKLMLGAVEVADDLLAIINDLLELAKIREGRARAPWSQTVNLNQLLADLFDSMAPDAEARQVALVPDFKGVATLDWGVPPDLVHAFENLIYNGIKYSRRGGEVVVRLRTRSEAALVEIADRGIGIPGDFLGQVFLEFVRAPNAKHHACEGTGLGLTIVKEVVEGHGGRITVDSRKGEGTTFAVHLPLDHEPPAAQRLSQVGNDTGYQGDTAPDVT